MNNIENTQIQQYSDEVGRFAYATIMKKIQTNLKIHYDGWSEKWDVWSDYRFEIDRFAKAGSMSRRAAHRFKDVKAGDSVCVNPIKKHPGWRVGEIKRLDGKSGQIQVVYEYDNENFKYWTHLDNKEEVKEHIISQDTGNSIPINSNKKQFVSHLALQECHNLKTYDFVDHRFVCAHVLICVSIAFGCKFNCCFLVFFLHCLQTFFYFCKKLNKRNTKNDTNNANSDSVGQFIYSQIVAKQGSRLRIHYIGWSIQWNVWSDYTKELHRFAQAKSISNRPAHRFKFLKIGDLIDINPIAKHSDAGWKIGIIKKFCNQSGQINVAYKYSDKYCLYWAHLDNKNEVALLRTHTSACSDSETQIADLTHRYKRFLTQNPQIELKNKQIENRKNEIQKDSTLMEKKHIYEREKNSIELSESKPKEKTSVSSENTSLRAHWNSSSSNGQNNTNIARKRQKNVVWNIFSSFLIVHILGFRACLFCWIF